MCNNATRHPEQMFFLLHQVGQGFDVEFQYLLAQGSCPQPEVDLRLLPNEQSHQESSAGKHFGSHANSSLTVSRKGLLSTAPLSLTICVQAVYK